eukprot:CFRG5898T1
MFGLSSHLLKGLALKARTKTCSAAALYTTSVNATTILSASALDSEVRLPSEHAMEHVRIKFPRKSSNCLTGKSLWDIIGRKKHLGVGDVVATRRMTEMFRGNNYYTITRAKPAENFKGGDVWAIEFKDGVNLPEKKIRGALKKKWKIVDPSIVKKPIESVQEIA